MSFQFSYQFSFNFLHFTESKITEVSFCILKITAYVFRTYLFLILELRILRVIFVQMADNLAKFNKVGKDLIILIILLEG